MVKENQVLIASWDHSFYLADVTEEDVVLDIVRREYSEYAGQELAEYEKLVKAKVAR